MRTAAGAMLGICVALSLGSTAFAATDAVSTGAAALVATSPDATTDQIAQWLATPDSPQAAPQDDADPGPRKMHGEAGVGFGSNGYRSAYAVVDMPIGEASDLGVAVSDAHYGHGRGFGGGESKSLAISLNIGGSAGLSRSGAGRCARSGYADAALAPGAVPIGPAGYGLGPGGYPLAAAGPGWAGCDARFDSPDVP